MGRISLLICSLLLAIFSYGQSIYVIDGDTFIYNGEKIRLYNVDCNEISMPLGYEAKEFTRRCLKWPKIIRLSRDRYGRTIAKVVLNNGKDLSLLLVRQGMAVVDSRYCNDSRFYVAEKIAKREKKGIWKYKHPEKPWEYRKRY